MFLILIAKKYIKLKNVLNKMEEKEINNLIHDKIILENLNFTSIDFLFKYLTNENLINLLLRLNRYNKELYFYTLKKIIKYKNSFFSYLLDKFSKNSNIKKLIIKDLSYFYIKDLVELYNKKNIKNFKKKLKEINLLPFEYKFLIINKLFVYILYTFLKKGINKRYIILILKIIKRNIDNNVIESILKKYSRKKTFFLFYFLIVNFKETNNYGKYIYIFFKKNYKNLYPNSIKIYLTNIFRNKKLEDKYFYLLFLLFYLSNFNKKEKDDLLYFLLLNIKSEKYIKNIINIIGENYIFENKYKTFLHYIFLLKNKEILIFFLNKSPNKKIFILKDKYNSRYFEQSKYPIHLLEYIIKNNFIFEEFITEPKILSFPQNYLKFLKLLMKYKYNFTTLEIKNLIISFLCIINNKIFYKNFSKKKNNNNNNNDISNHIKDILNFFYCFLQKNINNLNNISLNSYEKNILFNELVKLYILLSNLKDNNLQNNLIIDCKLKRILIICYKLFYNQLIYSDKIDELYLKIKDIKNGKIVLKKPIIDLLNYLLTKKDLNNIKNISLLMKDLI